jgi:hypothetical protein
MSERFSELDVTNGVDREQVTLEFLEEWFFENREQYRAFVKRLPTTGDGTISYLQDPKRLYVRKERIVNRCRLTPAP